MEMEFNDGRSRGRFVIVMGLILAVVAGGAAFFLISQAQQRAACRPTVPIVVATRHIPPRKPIEAADVAVRQVPIDATNAQGVFTDPTKVIGLIPTVAILAGQPIYANFLASQAQGGQFSILQPGESIAPDSEAWRAVSVTVPDDRAVGGLVHAGDTVDVFVTASVVLPDDVVKAGRYYIDKSTKITYQDVLVLAKAGQFYILKVPAARRPRRSATSRPAARLRSASPCGRRPTRGSSTPRGSARRRASSSSATGCRSRRRPDPGGGRSAARRPTPEPLAGAEPQPVGVERPWRGAPGQGRLEGGVDRRRVSGPRRPLVSMIRVATGSTRSTRPAWRSIRRSASAGARPRRARRSRWTAGSHTISQISSTTSA